MAIKRVFSRFLSHFVRIRTWSPLNVSFVLKECFGYKSVSIIPCLSCFHKIGKSKKFCPRTIQDSRLLNTMKLPPYSQKFPSGAKDLNFVYLKTNLMMFFDVLTNAYVCREENSWANTIGATKRDIQPIKSKYQQIFFFYY
jgi:hypothetical protein